MASNGQGSGRTPDLSQLVDLVTQAVVCELEKQGYRISGDTVAAGHDACHAVNTAIHFGADRVGTLPGDAKPPNGLAHYIDHTLLKPDARPEDIDKICAEAREYRFAAVCVNPAYTTRAVRNLEGSGIPVAVVVGFPLGAATPDIKAAETRDAVQKGAREIDMVINIGALKAGDFKLICDEIHAVVDAAGMHPVKVILETAMLDKNQKIAACVLSKAAGAAFVKTSTGFGPGGATVEDVALMREIVGPDMGVKASGGIRDTATARQMVSAGATRLGASASVAIVSGKQR